MFAQEFFPQPQVRINTWFSLRRIFRAKCKLFCEGATVSRFMQIIKKCLVWSNSAAVFLYPITFSIDADWDWSLYLISFTRIRRIIPILNTIQLSLTAVYRVQSVPATSPHPKPSRPAPQTISPPTCCLMRANEGLVRRDQRSFQKSLTWVF